jgi:hypothetical protein
MNLNTSVLFIDGGKVDMIDLDEKMSEADLFEIIQLHQKVSSMGEICGDHYRPDVYVIHKIDTVNVDGEVYPRIYIKQVEKLEYDVRDFNPNSLVVGLDLNNQKDIKDINDVPYIYEKVNIFFSEHNKLNGCYRVCEISIAVNQGNICPRILVEKYKILAPNLRYIDLSKKEHTVGY